MKNIFEEAFAYDLLYTMAMVEAELDNDLLKYGSEVLSERMSFGETTNLQVIEEGVRDVLLKYIDKVATSVQDAWTKFKNLIDEKQQKYFESLKAYVDKAPEDLSYNIDNIKVYDLGKFDDIKLPLFNYEDMKEHCENQEAFIGQYYPMLNVKQFDGSIRKAVDAALNGRLKPTMTIGTQDLKDQYEFLTKGYYEMREDLQKDIDTVNNSNKVIAQIANSISNDALEKPTMPATTGTEEAYQFYLSESALLLEEDDGSKPVVSDNNGEQAPSDASPEEKKKFGNQAITKVVVLYYKVGTQVMTCKMMALNRVKKNAQIIINYYVDGEKKKNAGAGKDDGKPTPTEVKEVK